MADELDSFFAKKATKKAKKNIVQDTDSLAKRLEKAVRHQEELDRVREEEEQRNRELALDNQRRTQPVNEEDSEWIDLEAEVDIGLTDGLKELEIEEIHENEKQEAPEIAEKPKTWNPVNATENQENENIPSIEGIPEVVQKASAYVAPSRRMASAKNSQPNIQDAEEFPSLMAAEDITKKEFETKKQKALKAKEFAEREKEAQQRRQVIMTELEQETQHAPQPNPWKTSLQQKTDAVAVDQQSAPYVPGPGKYVPPRGGSKPAAVTELVELPMEALVPAAVSAPPSDKPKYVPPHLRNK